MGVFFIDTSDGQVATMRQLVDAGLADGRTPPPRPWLQIQGSRDASTLWYAILRKRERGIYLGTMTLRHQGHHEKLLRDGWEEVPIDEIGIPGRDQPQAT